MSPNPVTRSPGHPMGTPSPSPQVWGSLGGWLQGGTARLRASVSLRARVCRAGIRGGTPQPGGPGWPRTPASAPPGHLGTPEQGLPPVVLSWRGITLINPCWGSAGAAGVTGAGTEGTAWGHRGWHRGVPQERCLAPVGAAEGVSPGWGGVVGEGVPQRWVGVAGPRGAPLTLPVPLLQPLGHQDGEWPPGGREGGSGRRWVPHPGGAQALVNPGSAGHSRCAHRPRDPTGTRGSFVSRWRLAVPRVPKAAALRPAPAAPRHPDTPTHAWAVASCGPLPSAPCQHPTPIPAPYQPLNPTPALCQPHANH